MPDAFSEKVTKTLVGFVWLGFLFVLALVFFSFLVKHNSASGSASLPRYLRNLGSNTLLPPLACSFAHRK